ncbi:metal-sensing transcriptional repressor [Paenibacillus antri]|uniref:Metal-sensing transcriptional repressor n=1 Tax=Paenibacillus antri TaxID=2582848 RepID=A0A5R9GC25_9BACL|nr:metal-sensing transcriptional repressor [Paenibacillus antri]TLS51610.1 metal-sensing transcriptional repressor [Paenibacillus antri]
MNERTELLLRLREIEDRIRDLKNGVKNDLSCDEALIRIAAIQAALREVSGGLFEDHWRRCVVSHIRAGDADAVERFMHSVAKVLR